MTSISSLPIHVVAEILRKLDHVRDLPAILLSQRIFYRAFGDTPGLLVDILRRQIPKPLFQLALVTHISSGPKRTAVGLDAAGFLTEYLDQPGPLHARADYTALTLAEAIRIEELHAAVARLTEIFCRRTLIKFYGLHRDDPRPDARRELSWAEKSRIFRAFYRFQIYNNLFSRYTEGDVVPNEWMGSFYKRYTPWVNEQLRCIYDVLGDLINCAFKRIMSETFEWGDNLTTWIADKSDYFAKEQTLSLNLLEILQLLESSSCDVWAQSRVNSKRLAANDLPKTLNVFNASQEPPNQQRMWTDVDLKHLEARLYKEDYDMDEGPYKMWAAAWGYWFGPITLGSQGRQGVRERLCGYVMWDEARGEGFGERLARTADTMVLF